MNGLSRVLQALQRQTPDKVPIMELSIDWRVMHELGYNDYLDMIDALDLDGVSVNQLQYKTTEILWIDRSQEIFKDHWGCVLTLGGQTWPTLIEAPIKEPEDFKTYRVPNPEDDPILKTIPLVTKRFKGKRAIVYLGRAVYGRSWHLRGLDQFLMDLLLNQKLVRQITKMVKEYHIELHRLVLNAGVDIIVLPDDYASKTGLMMSPELFKEFILPGLTEIVTNIKEQGGLCIKHSDGNIWSIIEKLVATGIDGIGPLEPAADMDLFRVKQQYGDRVCVMGNIDVDLLSRGSEDDVRESIKDLIARVSKGGGHILSSGNSITSSVQPNNFKAMIDTAREFGRYL